MIDTTFDTLLYAKQLKEVGFSDAQAEVQAEALKKISDGQLTSKQEVFVLKEESNGLRTDMNRLRMDVIREIDKLRTEVKTEIKEMEYKLIIKVGILFFLGFGALAAILKL